MCIVSAINDYGRERIEAYKWNPDSWREFTDLLKKAEKVDKVLDQPDCETTDKTTWMEKIQERIDALELELSQKKESLKLAALRRFQKEIDEAHRKLNLAMETINRG